MDSSDSSQLKLLICPSPEEKHCRHVCVHIRSPAGNVRTPRGPLGPVYLSCLSVRGEEIHHEVTLKRGRDASRRLLRARRCFTVDVNGANQRLCSVPQRFRTEFSEGKITGRVSTDSPRDPSRVRTTFNVYVSCSATTATSTTGATRAGR